MITPFLMRPLGVARRPARCGRGGSRAGPSRTAGEGQPGLVRGWWGSDVTECRHRGDVPLGRRRRRCTACAPDRGNANGPRRHGRPPTQHRERSAGRTARTAPCRTRPPAASAHAQHHARVRIRARTVCRGAARAARRAQHSSGDRPARARGRLSGRTACAARTAWPPPRLGWSVHWQEQLRRKGASSGAGVRLPRPSLPGPVVNSEAG